MSSLAPAVVTGVCTLSAGVLALTGAIVLRSIDVKAQNKATWRDTRLQTAAEYVTSVHRLYAEVRAFHNFLDIQFEPSERILISLGHLTDNDDARPRQLKVESLETELLAVHGRIQLVFPRDVVDLAAECFAQLRIFREDGEGSVLVLVKLRTFTDAVKNLLHIPQESELQG